MAEQKDSRALFEIRVFNKDTDERIHSEEVIADGEKEALFESRLKEVLKEKDLTRDDVVILIREFGPVPAKEKVKMVKIVGQMGKMVLGKEQ